MGDLSRALGVTLADEEDQRLTSWLEERIDGPMKVGSTADASNLRFTVARLRRGSLYEGEIQTLESAPTSGG